MSRPLLQKGPSLPRGLALRPALGGKAGPNHPTIPGGGQSRISLDRRQTEHSETGKSTPSHCPGPLGVESLAPDSPCNLQSPLRGRRKYTVGEIHTMFFLILFAALREGSSANAGRMLSNHFFSPASYLASKTGLEYERVRCGRRKACPDYCRFEEGGRNSK